jgi:serine/threonine-protein kinase RsbW
MEGPVTEQTTTGPIELVLPPDTRLVRVARLVASGVATTAGFDVDELEDLRIAVDELCAALVEGGNGGALSLRFDLSPFSVSVHGSTPISGEVELEPERLLLSRQILRVVVDEYDIEQAGGELRVQLHKRRADA